MARLLPDPPGYLAAAVGLARSGRPLVFLDTETTGLPGPDRPVPEPWQIAAIRREPDGSSAEGNRILRTTGPLPEAVCRLCNVDPDYPARVGAEPRDVLARFGRFIADAVLVGQNSVSFDHAILRAAYERAGLPLPIQLMEAVDAHVVRPQDALDTKFLGQAVLEECLPRHAVSIRRIVAPPGAPRGMSLASMARYLGIAHDPAGLHDARADVRLTALVFDELVIRGRAILRATGVHVP